MKTRHLTLEIIVVTSVVFIRSLAGSDVDHLLPVNLEEMPVTRGLLRSKLGPTPFDCGRSTVWPPFQGEACVSIYGKSKGGRRTYWVTFVSAEENIYQRTDGGHHPEKAKTVTTKRVDAEIPERTALLLRKVWMKMLQGPHGARPTPPPKRPPISIDGTLMEWSLERRGAPPLYGMLDVSLPFPGEKTRQFFDLSEAVYQYSQAIPDKRPGLVDKIDKQATKLLKKLKS